MDFGQALEAIKAGKMVERRGWNGRGMFLFMISEWLYTDGKHDNYTNQPFIAMKTVDHQCVPWLASQTDMLAEDWHEVGED